MFGLEAPEGAAFDFLVLFAVVLLGPALMARARIPGIIGLLLGGWLIGPHGLGLIGGGNQTIPEIGQLGLLYLMFVAGLELDLAMLRLHRRTAIGFGVITFAVPFAAGVGVGQLLGFGLAASLLLGSLVASHTLILYPMVRDAGLGSNRAVASAVGATVLTDTISLVVLAGVSGSETGSGSPVSTFLELGVGLAALVVGSLLVLPAIVQLVFRHIGSDRSVRFLTALLSFLLMASLAEVFGIEGIVGAFFAGLAMNPLVPNEGTTMHRLEFFGSSVFIPVFLVSTGLLLEPAVMVEPETLKYAGLFVLACLGGKAVAAAVSMPFFGVTRPEAGLMFVLTTPQAAATLAATVVGFNIGLFSTVVVNAVLVLILVSIVGASVVAPVFVRRVERPSEAGRPVGERVLLAVGAVPTTRVALQLAARVARHSGGVVDWLLVRHPGPVPIDRSPVPDLAVLTEREGFDGEVHVAVDPLAARAVVNGATSHDASLVIVDASVELNERRHPSSHWAEAMAMTVPTPILFLHGESDRIERALVFTPHAETAAAEAAVSFLCELASVATGDPHVQIDSDRPGWVDQLRPGDVAFVLAQRWEAFDALPEPPPGVVIAALPTASVLGQSTPTVLA